MFCGNCGKQVPDGSGFCPACGTAVGSGGSQPSATVVGAGGTPSAAAAQRAKIEAQLKAGSQDAVQAFMVLLKDPVGGLAKSFSIFDADRAQVVGGMFGLAFAICFTVFCSVVFDKIAGLMVMMSGGMGSALSGPPSLGVGQILKFFIIGAIYFVAMVLGCLVARIILKAETSLPAEIYVSGASLLPATVLLLASLILLNLGSLGLYLFVGAEIFAGCYTVLMLYAGFSHIGKLPEGKASFAVPVSLLIAGVISYVAVRVLM